MRRTALLILVVSFIFAGCVAVIVVAWLFDVKLFGFLFSGTAESVVADPVGNLTGDPTRSFLDIIKAGVSLKGEAYTFTVTTAAPFPDPSQMGNKRMDIIWFVDSDRNRHTGQTDRGNDYNIHLFLDETGWHGRCYKVSPVSQDDGKHTAPNDFAISVQGATAALSFSDSFLPSRKFDWWATCSTLNAPKWLPLTANPPTQRATFEAGWKLE